MRSLITAALVVHVCVAAPTMAQQASPRLDQYLRRTIGLDSGQIAAAQHGQAVVKLLKSENARDIAIFGMIAIRVPREAYLPRVLDAARLIGTRASRFGIVDDPASTLDVANVTVDRSEYRELRRCQRGSCNFKLPASAMETFAREVDWTASDAKVQVEARVRSALLQLIAAYRARGDGAMVTYDDVGGVHSSDVFASLLAQSPELYDYAPELHHHLTAYPSNGAPHARDVLYWSEDRMEHLRPTLTLNHLVAYTPTSGATIIARKQIYASHYLEGAFELLAVVDAPASDNGAGVYLLTVRRYRFDNLPGGLLNVRGRVRDAFLNQTRSDLERARTASEKARAN
jgi:hypothetical protein